MVKLNPISGLDIEVIRRPLIFKKPAKTSRDTITEKPCYFLKATNAQGQSYLGECSLIPGLSLESESDAFLELQKIASGTTLDLNDIPSGFSSVKFAVEMLLLSLHGLTPKSDFSIGAKGLEINGLIWMDDINSMLEQAIVLKSKGFKTIKLKVGAHEFEKELELLREIRSLCPAGKYTLRVDANGAFKKDASKKLQALSELHLHSIEQPIPAGNTHKLAKLCSTSAVPIALDEELIAIRSRQQKGELLDEIKPQFIVLKPSLIGGFAETEEWIELAESRDIGWWITSALESNIGLRAIAEFTGLRTKESSSASGLGTGSLYKNNLPSDLIIVDGKLWVETPGELIIEGRSWTLNQDGAAEFFEDNLRSPWTNEIADLLKAWFSNDAPIECSTSGSTGNPQLIKHGREAIIASAKETLEHFSLPPHSKAVLALPVNFIAGKMMLIRAIIGRLKLEAVEPGLNMVWSKLSEFTALTPHQCSLIFSKHNAFPPTSTLLLGGGPVGRELVLKFPDNIDVYEGYGMTETLTHVALRKICGYNLEIPFEALEGISFGTSSEGKLIIDAPTRNVHSLVTDDLVELHSATSFTWLGRHSDIINSGGIKFNPSQLEDKLRTVISHDLAIFSTLHPDLGEAITLMIDSEEKSFDDAIKSVLSGKEIPRVIRFGPIIRNESGKILRKQMGRENG